MVVVNNPQWVPPWDDEQQQTALRLRADLMGSLSDGEQAALLQGQAVLRADGGRVRQVPVLHWDHGKLILDHYEDEKWRRDPAYKDLPFRRYYHLITEARGTEDATRMAL